MSTQRNICILSPHCDDAVLALGGYILLNLGKVHVIDVFATTAWTTLDETWSVEEITQVNQIEERHVLDAAQTTYELIETPEALMRGYETWNEKTIAPDDIVLMRQVWNSIKPSILNYQQLYIPLAPGGHIDHRLVRNMVLDHLDELIMAGVEVSFFEDLPYSWYDGLAEEIALMSNELRLTPQHFEVSDVLDSKIDLLRGYRCQLADSDIKKVKEHAERIKHEALTERVWRISKRAT